ncbi:hypothetical protein [Bradyrhizobium sp. Arg816]|uniref:hypothetical protein n=1 Tax=Bradyrhizobium sp. Arg816 TaxID=2998491 RepID=UPI00249F1234|nr:hypothetical protein [Bradyrhizobium sp. Arg816]MDI3563936.1 hypothetical protein [Bradyrhizobium sp. Arg816]
MLFEDEAPPTSGEEARARRVRPVEERYDPDKLSHWSITMTIAWIVWGDLGYVRQQWNDFREECADWSFYTDPAALAEVGRLALRNLENGEVAPNDPDLDRRLKKGEWRLTPWGSSSWHGLEMVVRSEGIAPEVSIDGLWLGAGEGKIQASGFECANARDFDGKLVEIPHYLWPRLRRAKELSGKALLAGPDRVYRDVRFSRLDVKALWPLAEVTPAAQDDGLAAPADAPPQTSAIRSEDQAKVRGRRPGQGSYASLDAPLLLEMKRLLAEGRAASAEEAARQLAVRAFGAGTVDSKAERLARRFREEEAKKAPSE